MIAYTGLYAEVYQSPFRAARLQTHGPGDHESGRLLAASTSVAVSPSACLSSGWSGELREK